MMRTKLAKLFNLFITQMIRQLFYSERIKDMQDMKSTVNFDLVFIAMLLQTNRLTLIVSKSYFMLRGFLKNFDESNILIRNKNLQQTRYLKFLGVTIDDKLKFDIHYLSIYLFTCRDLSQETHVLSFYQATNHKS